MRAKLGTPYRGYLPGDNGYPGRRGTADIGLSLYDLRRDPGEQYNVAELYPEVVARLTALAETARTDMGDNLTARPGKNRRKAGEVSP